MKRSLEERVYGALVHEWTSYYKESIQEDSGFNNIIIYPSWEPCICGYALFEYKNKEGEFLKLKLDSYTPTDIYFLSIKDIDRFNPKILIYYVYNNFDYENKEKDELFKIINTYIDKNELIKVIHEEDE